MLFFATWQRVLILGLCLIGLILSAPNLLPKPIADKIPAFLPSRQVSLGLDLRGGSYLLMQIDEDAMVKERLDVLREDVRAKLLSEKIGYREAPKIANRSIQFALADPGQRDRTLTALGTLAQPLSTLGGNNTDLDIEIDAQGEARIAPNEAGLIKRRQGAVQQSIEIVRRRVDETGVSDVSVQPQGAGRILVQVPGVSDPTRLKALIGKTAKLTFHMVNETATDLQHPPPDSEVLPEENGKGKIAIFKRSDLSGESLTDAQPGFDSRNGQPVVNFRFDRAGARRFADITAKNVHQRFAIVLDNKVITAPVINEPIMGGSGQISGNFTVDSANDLAVLLRAGALPVPLTVIEERSIGPDLGADAIRAGLISVSVGLVLVMAYMSAAYGLFGHFANIALLVNLVMIVGALSALGATLTLPGIAGILLTLGMAVDANVLINERIREEVRLGKKPIGAIESGFKRAFSTIFDANFTTLIKMGLLYLIGTGPVRGFAVTISLGILTSMFTATSLVRLIISWWYARVRPTDLLKQGPSYRLRVAKDDTNISFMSKRKWGLGISAVLSLASILAWSGLGLNYGIDFVGGTLVDVRAPEAIDFGKMRDALSKVGLGEAKLQTFGGPNEVLIRIEQQAGPDANQQKATTAAQEAFKSAYPDGEIRSTTAIGATVSGELFFNGMLGMGLAIVSMLIYIWFRFEWQFGVGAVATLILDVTKTMGFYVLMGKLFGFQFSLDSIAAILTIMGWSVNDKVVVYDRVRENLRKYKSMPLRELIDRSINETLNRTINVSATILLAILPLILFGGEALREFSIVMLFGIALATSSSIMIAAPILLLLGEGRLRRQKVEDLGNPAVPGGTLRPKVRT